MLNTQKRHHGEDLIGPIFWWTVIALPALVGIVVAACGMAGANAIIAGLVLTAVLCVCVHFNAA